MSLARFYFSFFLLVLTALPLSYSHGEETPLAAVFQRAYLMEGTIYRPGQCGRNVKELMLELQKNAFSLENSSALFLLSETRRYFPGGPELPGRLTPSYSRESVSDWDFHVVLKYRSSTSRQALILDLDGPSRPMTMEEYFSFMFPDQGNGDRLKKITVREIDAGSYLQAFEDYYRNRDPRLSLDDNYVVGDFRKPDLPLYPVTSLRDFLENETSRNTIPGDSR